ncbi:MAG: ferrochelatase [Candidatus Caenarcaniphilales bacterium]|nr:ferrochelatase [Candidatus Caenarcaniphilales bacterium]
MKADVAVILCNLGGPSSLDEVEPFLLSLLSDPNVIQLPWLLKPLQKPLARLIVKRRLAESKNLYREIGGKSPLVALTRIQAEALSQKIKLPVYVLMGHSHPNIRDLITEFKSLDKTPSKVLVLPLFPHYSTSTTKSSFDDIDSVLGEEFSDLEIIKVTSYPTHPKLVEAWVKRIQASAKHFKGDYELIFSAHSIPARYVQKGDPYLGEIQACIGEIMHFFPNQKFRLCFQSKLGPEKWLEPSTMAVLESLNPGTQVLIVPISFVSDHVETIHEIGKGFAEIARARNLKMRRTPGLNHDPTFIDCLASLVSQNLDLNLSKA